MSDDDAGNYMALAAFIGVISLVKWYRALNRSRLVDDTPVSRLRSAAQGMVALRGRVRSAAGRTTIAPLSGQPCVWWHVVVERRTKSDDDWDCVVNETCRDGFLLDDGTGVCVVDPTDAEMVGVERYDWSTETPPPSRALLATLNQPLSEASVVRYQERRLEEGARLCALGNLRTVPVAEVASELSTARTRVGVHLLSAPGGSGSLLLSVIAAGALAREDRWRAWQWMLLFAVSVVVFAYAMVG